jgi:hypothetical protein
MISEEALITFLQAQPTTKDYIIEVAENVLENWQETDELPIIYVGYATLDSKFPNQPIESTIFNRHGENIVQTFELHIVCASADFRDTWVDLYNALIGENPEPSEKIHSGFTYAQGGKMGRSNGKIYHIDLWRIGFPTNRKLR